MFIKRSIIFILLLVSSQLIAKSSEEAFTEAIDLYRTGDIQNMKKALIVVEEALQNDPNNAKLMSQLSLVYAHMSYRDLHFGTKETDYLKLARVLANNAIKQTKGKKTNDKIDPAYEAKKALANVLLIEGNRGEAKKLIEELIKQNPKDGVAFYMYACVSEGSIIDESSNAGQRMKKALELFPTYVFSLGDMTLAYLKAGQIDKAAEMLTKLEKDHSSNSELAYYQGMVALHQGKLDEARKRFQTYIDKNPTSNLSQYLKFYMDGGQQ